MISSRLVFATFVLGVPALAAPTGKIGFVGAKGAQILNLQNGAVRSLPQGARATTFTLSPQGTAIYFVAAPGAKPSSDGSGTVASAMQSSVPYSSVKVLPGLRSQIPYSQDWSPGGTTLYIATDKVTGAFVPVTGRLTPLKSLPGSFDATGRTMTYSSENQVLVRNIASGQERVLFDIRKPAPMFAALKAAKYPKKVEEFLPTTMGDLSSETRNWQLSSPAMAPDGSRLYFASNVGSGFGAAGNGSFALFAVDLKTYKLAVLSQVGTNFGRPPHIFQVSPDGQRLLMASSVHASAADNSCFVEIIDLLTQKSREVFLGVLPGSKDKANFLNSAVWSPDGKYVAVSGYFYDPAKAMDDYNGSWAEVKPTQYTTGIVDAATGKLVRTIKGATNLSWIK
ncbi:hypothetical protein EON83_09385 [bacterium]|nr:MAG: hypothetical protein EON83_09385 [bacterium]